MKPEPVTQITCPNPLCGRQHGLFYYIYKQGPRLRRQLSYRCDHVERVSHNNHEGNPIIVRSTAVRIAPDNIAVPLGLPEEYTPAAREFANKKAQLQLAIPTVRK